MKGITLLCWKDLFDQALVFLRVPRRIAASINFSSSILKAITAFFFSFAAEFQAHAKASALFLGHWSALSFPPLTEAGRLVLIW